MIHPTSPTGVSRGHQIGWIDANHAIVTWPSDSEEPLRQYLLRLKEIAAEGCQDKEYAAGVVQRCDQYLGQEVAT